MEYSKISFMPQRELLDLGLYRLDVMSTTVKNKYD